MAYNYDNAKLTLQFANITRAYNYILEWLLPEVGERWITFIKKSATDDRG